MSDSELGGSERFVFPRHPIRIVVLVREEDAWRPYFTTNLSATGALLEFLAAPAQGCLLECMLSEHGVFEFKACVVRLATGGVGVEFVEPTPEFSAAIGRIVAGHQELYG